MEENLHVVETKKMMTRKTTTSMIFALVWGLIIGAGAFFRFDDMGDYWQSTLITYNYFVSAVLYFIAVFMFWRGNTRLGKILSLLGFYPGLIAASILQGGGSSIMILVVMGAAFGLTYAFLVEEKETRNRFLLYGLGAIAISLVLYYIPFSFRYVTGEGESGNAGVPIMVVAAVIATVLIIWNFSELWNGFSNFSIRFKLSFFVLISLLGVASISGYYLITSAEQELMRSIHNVLEETNNGLVGSTETWLEENVNTLKAVSTYPAIVGMDPAEQKPILEAIDANNQNVFLVQTTNTRGINVARNDDVELKDYSDRAWYLGPMAGNDLTMQSLISRTIGKPALAVSVPIRQESGTIVGVLQMALEFTSLTEAIGATSIGATGSSYILDDSNILIAHTDQSYFELDYLVDFTDNPAVSAYRSGETDGVFHYEDVDGVDRLAVVTELGEFGWLVVVSVKADEILVPIQSLTSGTLLALGLMLLIAVPALWFLLSRTVKPISDLTEVTRMYASGDFNARATVTSEDEVGQLGRAFNQMAAEVGGQSMALAERAREMEASQRVTFAASERTTPDDFLDLLVNLIADQFDIYHCQVYLVDEDKKQAVLSQSTGYAGRQLLQRGHSIPLDAQSLVTQCINTGEAVLVAETTKDPNWLPNPLLPYTQSELVVPLKIGNVVIGVMDVQDRVASRFTEETIPVFQSMTEHVAFLYQNNELLENIEKAQLTQQQFVTQLETTSEVASALNTILDPTQLLDEAVTMLQSKFNFYHAHIYLIDEAKENLVVASGSGNVGVILKDRGHSIPVTAEQSFVANAYRNATPVRVGDTTQDPNWLPNPLLPDTRAEMALPLITRGQVIGVLDIQDEVAGRFTEVDEDTMLTLAGQLATSVDTARLFVNVENAAERDRKRFEISTALSGDLSEDQVWDILLEKAKSENVLISLNLAEKLEDGDILITPHRVVSTDPAMTAPSLGDNFKASENPVIGLMKPGEMLITNDLSTDDRFNPGIRDYLLSQGVVSLMASPFALAGDEEWHGMIRVSSREPGFFDADRASMYDDLIELGTAALRSARLRAEIASSEQRFRTISDFTYAWETWLSEEGKLVYVSPSCERVSGYTREEFINDPTLMDAMVYPEDKKVYTDHWHVHQTPADVDPIEYRIVRKDGEVVWISHFCQAVHDEDGEFRGRRGSNNDITERHQAEKAIVQGDRLKSEFLANMSHELRTPLNSILGYTDVLLMGLDGDLDEEVTTDLEAIHENSQHLLNLINDILDLAKIEAGRMTIELGDVNIADLLAEVKKTSAGLLVNKDVEMVVDVAKALPAMLADYHRVYQVINNLVSNSVKFTEKGTITLKAFAENNDMVLEVIDTGIGISQEDLDAIFEEFTQADTSSTRQHEGTGLGLTITRRLVQMHGGSISVESELGKGSTFTARFPLQAKVDPELLLVSSSANGNK